MRILPLILILPLWFGCPKVKVLEATSQEWAGGRQESGFGTRYVIHLQAKRSSDKLEIDQIWIGENYFDIKELRSPQYKKLSSFSRGDTLTVNVGVKYQVLDNGKTQQIDGTSKEPPKAFSGAALLGYRFKGKRKYIEIETFKQLEKIIYP